MRVRLSENAPKADSRNANPVPAMVEVVEPARASGSCVCRVGASSTVSSCVGDGSGSGSGAEIIGTGTGSSSGIGTGVGSGSNSGSGSGGTGVGGTGVGGTGVGGTGVGGTTGGFGLGDFGLGFGLGVAFITSKNALIKATCFALLFSCNVIPGS